MLNVFTRLTAVLALLSAMSNFAMAFDLTPILDRIPGKILLSPQGPEQTYKVGPSGGNGGSSFYELAGRGERICGLVIREYARVDGIQLKICTNETNAVRYSKYFGGYGGESREISFEPDEFVTGLDVCTAPYYRSRRVYGVDVYTSKKDTPNYKTYSSARHGTAKSKCAATVKLQAGKITREKDVITGFSEYRAPTGYSIKGLHGRSGREVDALGVFYAKNIAHTWQSFYPKHGGGIPQGVIGHGEALNDYGLFISSSALSAGEFDSAYIVLRGVNGRKRTNELDPGHLYHGRLCGFTVKHGDLIDSLQTKQCDEVDNSLLESYKQSTQLGHGGGTRSDFDFGPNEDLKEIKVWYDHWVIRGLQFVTTKKTSPVYGKTWGVQGTYQIVPGFEVVSVTGNYYEQLRSLKIAIADKNAFSGTPTN